MLHTEFRDGNVPAGYEQLRVLQEALKFLPQESKGFACAVISMFLWGIVNWGSMSGVGKRMKAMRFSLIKLPGRVLKHARELIIRLTKDHPCFDMLIAARKKIMLLQTVPSG